jgi:hypothetical protein
VASEQLTVVGCTSTQPLMDAICTSASVCGGDWAVASVCSDKRPTAAPALGKFHASIYRDRLAVSQIEQFRGGERQQREYEALRWCEQ